MGIFNKSDDQGGDRARKAPPGQPYDQLTIPEIDPARWPHYDSIKAELNVIGNAQNDGRANRPGTGERELNEAQQRISNRVFTSIAWVHQYLADQLATAVSNARRSAPRPLDVAGARVAIDSRIGEALHDRRGELSRLRERELEALRDLNYFRRRHGLNRSASYRESPYLFAALLFGMLVLESLLNAFLLRRISEEGWVGGVVIAVLISAVNIGLGVIAGGVGWRLAGHRFWPQRVAGGLIGGLALIFALYWNLYVAHFREVAETVVAASAATPTIAASAIDALAHIRERGLFGLGTLFSWGLFAIGMGIHLLASKESWDDMADRYWDYKRYDQGYREARGDYEDALDELREDAAGRAREVIAGLEGTHQAQARRAEQIGALADLAVQRQAEARDAEGEWVRKGNALLKAYRDENLAVRTDAPPTYFGQYPTAEEYRQGRRSGDGLGVSAVEVADVEAARRDIERAIADLAALRDQAAAGQEANGAALTEARAFLSEALANVDQRVDAVRAAADRDAEANLSRRMDAEPEAAGGPTA